jgi:hypothetical protein
MPQVMKEVELFNAVQQLCPDIHVLCTYVYAGGEAPAALPHELQDMKVHWFDLGGRNDPTSGEAGKMTAMYPLQVPADFFGLVGL